jgi:hypothetical protein
VLLAAMPRMPAFVRVGTGRAVAAAVRVVRGGQVHAGGRLGLAAVRGILVRLRPSTVRVAVFAGREGVRIGGHRVSAVVRGIRGRRIHAVVPTAVRGILVRLRPSTVRVAVFAGGEGVRIGGSGRTVVRMIRRRMAVVVRVEVHPAAFRGSAVHPASPRRVTRRSRGAARRMDFAAAARADRVRVAAFVR